MRIRSIKPDFWRSDDIDALDWPTRLLFIGLWSYVDDNGVGIDKMSSIVADLFAADLEDNPRDTLATVSRGLQTLSDARLITRYTVDGKRYLHVISWERHQRIDRPGKARYPLPTCGNAEIAESSRHPRDAPSTGEGEEGRRGEGEETPLAQSADADVRDADRFEEFWDAYDKKTGKKAARQKWNLAVKKKGVSSDLLIEATRTYIAGLRSAGKHPTFTKDPATWLNGEHWEDETTSNVSQLRPDRPRRNGLAFVPTCPTCAAPPENVHDPECPNQSWTPPKEGARQ